MYHLPLRQQDLLWAVRRLPKALRHLMLKEGSQLIVAGGYVRACVANETVSDVDCFAPSKEKAKEWAEALCKKPYESDNAYTCSLARHTVQFIHRWTYTDAVQLLESFDFTVAMGAIWFEPEYRLTAEGKRADGLEASTFVARSWMGISHPDFYPDLAAKRIVYTSPMRNEDAGGSLLRVLKFYQKGYRIPLDSLAAVMSRLMTAVKMDELHSAAYTIGAGQSIPYELAWEQQLAKVLTGLLREVDPNIDPEHLYHLPSTVTAEENLKGEAGEDEPNGE